MIDERCTGKDMEGKGSGFVEYYPTFFWKS
jgi:hypothetical protein